MRNKFILGIIAIIGFFISLALHQHIRVLRDIVHTYSTFYPLLQSHASLLYKYPAPIARTDQIPRIIHQVALGNVNMAKYQDGIKSCRALHPGWKFNLWTDRNGTAFIAEHYPEILPHYLGYHQNIQRANVLRYGVLHFYGGVYFDLDMTCLMPLDQTPLVDLPFVTPGAHPAGVNNAFILARPGHAFLSRILSTIPRHDLYWGLLIRFPYIENMLSTGCMFFSNMWMQYAGDVIAGHQKERIYIPADEHGDMAPHMWRGIVKSPIMAHGGDSSWHSWDAGIIVTMGKHYRLVLSALAVGITFGIMFLLCLCYRARIQGRRVWRKQSSKVIFW